MRFASVVDKRPDDLHTVILDRTSKLNGLQMRDEKSVTKKLRVLADLPVCAVPYAAELEVFPSESVLLPARSVPIDAQVSFGSEEFIDSGRSEEGFRLSFRRAIVEVRVHQARISQQNRYERTLPKEQFCQIVNKISEESGIGKGKVDGGLSAAIRAVMAVFGVDFRAAASIERSMRKGDILSVEGENPFKLVRYVAAGRWEIGHEEFGDPTELDGLLRGSYIRTQPHESENAALCHIENVNEAGFEVTIELRVKFADCDYVPLGSMVPKEHWRRINKAVVEKQLVMKMLQEDGRAYGFTPPEGEVILARAGLSAMAA